VSSLSLRRGLIDTPILVDSRLAEPQALQFIADMLQRTGPIVLSELTGMAMMARCQDADELDELINGFLVNSRVHPITAAISHGAYRIMTQLPAPSPLNPDDALIAATALIHKLPLYTLDPGRFGIVPGLNCIQPY